MSDVALVPRAPQPPVNEEAVKNSLVAAPSGHLGAAPLCVEALGAGLETDPLAPGFLRQA